MTYITEEPFAADLPQGSTLKRQSPALSPTAQTAQLEKFLKQQESPQISGSELSSPSVTPANFDFQRPQSNDPVSIVPVPSTPHPTAQTAQLEKFLKQQESPQISGSELLSPSVTPANFDFQRPQSNDPVKMVLLPSYSDSQSNGKNLTSAVNFRGEFF